MKKNTKTNYIEERREIINDKIFQNILFLFTLFASSISFNLTSLQSFKILFGIASIGLVIYGIKNVYDIIKINKEIKIFLKTTKQQTRKNTNNCDLSLSKSINNNKTNNKTNNIALRETYLDNYDYEIKDTKKRTKKKIR